MNVEYELKCSSTLSIIEKAVTMLLIESLFIPMNCLYSITNFWPYVRWIDKPSTICLYQTTEMHPMEMYIIDFELQLFSHYLTKAHCFGISWLKISADLGWREEKKNIGKHTKDWMLSKKSDWTVGMNGFVFLFIHLVLFFFSDTAMV